MNNIKLLKPSLIISDIIRVLPSQRSQDILLRRFGLAGSQPETLESIGRSFGITRERVRQVEKASLRQLMDKGSSQEFSYLIKYLDKYLSDCGKLCREETLMNGLPLVKGQKPEDRAAVYFALNLGQSFNLLKEGARFYNSWYNDKKLFVKIDSFIGDLAGFMEKSRQVMSRQEICDFASKFYADLNVLPAKAFLSYIDASKPIEQNALGKFGLYFWPEIKPRGVKDRAFLVLKTKSQPLHFVKITALINKLPSGFTQGRKAYSQTVHNELIKDSRFVLVGRGIYALKEWGFPDGTVKQVISSILAKHSQGMAKNAIIKKVLSWRLVKENTVLINLQNRQYFKRLDNGRYTLANNSSRHC